MLSLSPTKRFAIACGISSPILIYQPIKSLILFDKTNKIEPNDKLKRLINEVANEQNLNLNHFEILVEDELNFKMFTNRYIGKHKLIVPKYLQFESLKDLSSSYINNLLKKEYGLELKDREQWFTDEGKKIISSFLLSDHAKKFLLARYLQSLKNDTTAFSYFSLAVLLLYVPTQFIKWKNDLIEYIKVNPQKNDYNYKVSYNRTIKQGFWRFFFVRNQNILVYSLIASFIYLVGIFYLTIGLKSSRDSDALALSRGLSRAMMIKSKAALIDFNYYSGGEEALRKLTERDFSLNKLFFDGFSTLERFLKRIPFTADGDNASFFSNTASAQMAYENLNEWERNSAL